MEYIPCSFYRHISHFFGLQGNFSFSLQRDAPNEPQQIVHHAVKSHQPQNPPQPFVGPAKDPPTLSPQTPEGLSDQIGRHGSHSHKNRRMEPQRVQQPASQQSKKSPSPAAAWTVNVPLGIKPADWQRRLPQRVPAQNGPQKDTAGDPQRGIEHIIKGTLASVHWTKPAFINAANGSGPAKEPPDPGH